MIRGNTIKLSMLVYVLFFTSGFAALIYETSWSRMVGFVLGHTAQSSAIVLASYFFGLAIGQYLGGKLAKRFSPLFGYGFAELCAAAWGGVVPTLLETAGDMANNAATQAFVCFLVLLPATIPLGATLPFIVAVFEHQEVAKVSSVKAYAWNTAGGLMGVIATCAWLLTWVGVQSSGYFAASLSAGCGIIACLSTFNTRHKLRYIESHVVSNNSGSNHNYWRILVAISGFSTLGLEVLYTRMFALIFHNSTYTFAAVIVAFLLALALAAFVVPTLRKRFSALAILGIALSLGSISLTISLVAFRWSTDLNYFTFGQSFASYLSGAIGIVILFVFPTVFSLGLILPVAIYENPNSWSVGSLTAINTLASATGSILAGFVLPQMFGLWTAFAFFAVLAIIAGSIQVVQVIAKGYAVCLALALCLLVTVMIRPSSTVATNSKTVEILKRWETDYGILDVVRSKDGVLAIRQNLHYRHGSTGNAMNQYRMGRIPLLLHENPAEVAFIGIGTALTVAPTVMDDKVKRVEVIELIPEVIEAARLLKDANLGVLDHPKTSVHVEDARHYLKHDERKYDVIVSDLFVPWESKSGYLYTIEFYQAVQSHMKSGGLFCQWIALNQIGEADFELIANSFSSVFPNTTLWWGRYDARLPVLALIGSQETLDIDEFKLQERISNWNMRMPIKDLELRSPEALIDHVIGKWIYDKAAKTNTDEHPWLEFTAPFSQRNETTLAGKTLEDFFNRVLSKLPLEGIRCKNRGDGILNEKQRLSNFQKFVLFGNAD